MTSESEHTNRQRSPQQAQGRKWPILVLLLGLAALTLALTACGGSSSTSTPDADSATRVPEWEETVEFTVDWPDPHLVEVPVEKCEWVEFHLTAPVDVTARFHNPDGETGGNWGLVDDLHTVKMAEATGIWTLEVTNKFGRTTPTNVTVSWLVQPPRFEC